MPIAFICITTEPSSMGKVLNTLKAIEGVAEAHMIYGIYDIVAKVEADSIDQLKNIVTQKIRKIKNVTTTTTMIVEKSKQSKYV